MILMHKTLVDLLLKHLTQNWYMKKIGQKRYVKVTQLDLLTESLSLQPPYIYALTDCYATSHQYGIGKVKVMQNLVKDLEKTDGYWLE